MGVKPFRLPSVSKSALMLSPCIAWTGPGAQCFDESKVESKDTEKRDNGIAFHRNMDNYCKTGSTGDVRNDQVQSYLRYSIAYLTENLQPRCQYLFTEQAIAVNWLTGEARPLPEVTERGYPDLGPEWQCGTADIVALTDQGQLLVADWKTGGSEGAEEQLLSLAWAFSRVAPYNGILISCLSVNDQGVWPHERPVTPDELQNHADAMRFRVEDILAAQKAGKKAPYVPGIHCVTLYCPHLGHCGAIASDVGRLAGQAPEEEKGPMVEKKHLPVAAPLSPEDAGKTMASISAANRYIKYVTESMKEYVKKGGKVVNGTYEWADGGNGFRWRKA